MSEKTGVLFVRHLGDRVPAELARIAEFHVATELVEDSRGIVVFESRFDGVTRAQAFDAMIDLAARDIRPGSFLLCGQDRYDFDDSGAATLKATREPIF